MKKFLAVLLILSSPAFADGGGSVGSGLGSVTSVGISLPAALFNLSGTPVTTSGTLTGAFASQSGNVVLASPSNGSSGAWTARALVGADLPMPASATKGGVFSKAAVSHNFLTSISSVDGSVGQAQPACADLSNGAASCSTDTTNASNISSGTLPAGRLPLPAAAALGGVFSKASVSHNFLTSISSVDGSVGQAQPAFTDISGSVAASQMPALTGDVTTSAGAVATSLVATSNGTLATLSNSTGVEIHGSNTNDSASAGYKGENISSAVTNQSAPTSTNWGDLTSISLTAGDWLVNAQIVYAVQAGTTVSFCYAGVSTTSGNSSTGLTVGDTEMAGWFSSNSSSGISVPLTLAGVRLSLASTTTVYLKMNATWSSTTPLVSGRISARRFR